MDTTATINGILAALLLAAIGMGFLILRWKRWETEDDRRIREFINGNRARPRK